MIERFPKVKILLDHMARPALDDGPPYAAAASLFGLARYPNVYLKLTKRNFEQASSGKATPETFFPKLVCEFGAERLVLGLELSVVGRHAAGYLGARAQDARGLAAEGSGLDFRQDRAGALPRTEGLED